jgi:hypothetical protein
LEAAIDRDVAGDKWYDRLQISGLIEVAAGELYDPDTQQREPKAYTVELGAMIVDRLEVALRFGGADFLPESQYGAVLNWGVFESTNLAVEYLHDEFDDTALAVDQEADTVTFQLAVEF